MYESRDPKILYELFRDIANFHIDHGYDTYSFEGCFTELVQGGRGLTGQAGSIIKTKDEFESYPWKSLTDKYFQKFGIYFDSIRKTLPEGMKIVGGVGNGLFETIQDFVPSNEDAIAPFSKCVEDYGQRIGNFGGLDMDVICRSSEDVLRKYIRERIEPLMDTNGIAIGSGNQIADYVPPENFQVMVDEVRKIRGF